jgi:hypothetical protein
MSAPTSKPRNWTEDQIAAAIRATGSTGLHEHHDCIRMAGEWLDAQTRTARPNAGRIHPLKHIIENWCGRYVSSNDVEVAAHMLGMNGRYPCFALKTGSLVLPSAARLEGIGQAFTQTDTYESHRYSASYKRQEVTA